MSMSIKIDFSDHFNKVVGAKIDEIADKALQRTIAEADSICQREAPVDTGNLRRSIGTSHPSKCIVCLTCGAYYWRYQQYGTSKMKANPFVTRTAKQIIGDNLIQRNINDMLVLEGIIR